MTTSALQYRLSEHLRRRICTVATVDQAAYGRTLRALRTLASEHAIDAFDGADYEPPPCLGDCTRFALTLAGFRHSCRATAA